jgi:hypothetical protein
MTRPHPFKLIMHHLQNCIWLALACCSVSVQVRQCISLSKCDLCTSLHERLAAAKGDAKLLLKIHNEHMAHVKVRAGHSTSVAEVRYVSTSVHR